MKGKKKKSKTQPSTAFFIFTLPHSCQVNLISLCFTKNPKTSPKPILYSQKVLNKYTFTIIHNYFFWSHKSSSNFTFHLFWCVLTCNLSPNWNDSDKITTTFLISKLFPSCPSFILICVATSSLCTMLTSLLLQKFPFLFFSRSISANFWFSPGCTPNHSSLFTPYRRNAWFANLQAQFIHNICFLYYYVLLWAFLAGKN